MMFGEVDKASATGRTNTIGLTFDSKSESKMRRVTYRDVLPGSTKWGEDI